MHNVVNLQRGRPRPPSAPALPSGGARILFFTGVRYCREEAITAPAPGPAVQASERVLEAAAH